MKIKYIAIGLLTLGAGYGIAYFVRQGQLLEQTDVEYVDYKIQQLSLKRAQVMIRLRILNKSGWDFTVRYQQYEAKINGFKVADIKSYKPVQVYKNSSGITELIIDFNPQETIKTGLTQLISNFGNAQLTLEGYYSASTGIIVANHIPVDETWTMKNFKVT